jgi:hypothetical protein
MLVGVYKGMRKGKKNDSVWVVHQISIKKKLDSFSILNIIRLPPPIHYPYSAVV